MDGENMSNLITKMVCMEIVRRQCPGGGGGTPSVLEWEWQCQALFSDPQIIGPDF